MSIPETEKTVNDRLFRIFLLFNLLIATAIPSVMYRVLPLDTLEAVIWGQEFTMGNCKHPPLSGWIANSFSSLFGYSDFAMYFLSQLCVLVSYILIYLIAREFFNKDKSIIASVLLGFILHYSFDSAKFNVNVLHLALWPATAFYYLKAMKYDKFVYWVLLGVLAGLTVFCKLFGCVLLLMLLLFTIINKSARKRLTSYGPYLSVFLTLLVIAPYLVWMFQNDFLPLRYVGERVEEESYGLWFPFALFFMISYHVLVPLTGLVLSGGLPAIKRVFTHKPCVDNRDAMVFSGFLLFSPMAFMTLLAFFVPKIDPLWCYPVYFPCGIFFLSFVKDELITPKRVRWVLALVTAAILAFQTGDVIYFMVHPRITGHFPAREFAWTADAFYREHNDGKEIPYVCGTMWYACCVQHYLPYRPLVCIIEDPLELDRFRSRMEEKGGLLVVQHDEDLEFFKRHFDLDLKDGKRLTFKISAPLSSKPKTRSFTFCTIVPKDKR